MYYIHTISSISHQDSFEQNNLWETLIPLNEESTLITPDYKLYIPPAALRRLSPILRMAIAAAKKCQENSEDQIDAISIGTALGCLTDTEKFLVTFHTAQGDTLSPTAFIQSTHNTIGGQISLELKNHAYNMTHTQNGLSFEVALLDAMLCADDGKKAVLVGAADEAIGFLEQLQSVVIQDDRKLTSGTTCCILSKEQKSSTVAITDCLVLHETNNWQADLDAFLQKNGHELNTIDSVYVSQQEDTAIVENAICFIDYSGLYYSASAFALHMAHDKLLHSRATSALIINRICGNQLGAILLEKK